MRSRPSPATDDGSAVVETVLVTVLLLGLVLGVLEVALAGHVRSVLTAVAAEGARQGARAGAGPAAGAAYAQRAAGDALGGHVTCTGAAARDAASGLPTVVVRCRARLRVGALPTGSVTVAGTGGALAE